MQLDEYTLTQFLGKGTFGEVYLTTKKNTDFFFATKRMSKEFVEDPKYFKYFQNEIAILRRLYHKNIVRLEDLKKTNNHYYVIMEYCNGGSLTECLEKYKNLYHTPFTEEIVQHIMRQIVSAINYIHSLRIIHRDLKLDNILVKFENEIDKNKVDLLKKKKKIIDFGFAAYKDQSGLLSTAIGSPMNMDPIILKKFNSGGSVNKELGYDEKADIWSLGTLCYQMLIGNCAFDAYNMKELVTKVEEGTYKVPTNLSKEVVSFLNAMLQYNSKKRLGASELIKHAFLIKNVSDFTRIDMNKVSKKVYGGELKINIRENSTIWSIFNEEDEQKLNNIPANLFPNETPISESQYLGNLNGNNAQMISKDPFNYDKNFIDKEFKMANSTPINGLKFGMNNKTMPIPEANNNSLNLPNKIDEINNRNNFATPLKQNVDQVPNPQNNFKNNLLNPRTPQREGGNSGNNMLTIISKLNNGQILKTDVPMEKIKEQLIQNGLVNNNQVNMNLLNKFQQMARNDNIPNNLPPQNQLNIRQKAPPQNQVMNGIQPPQMNLPHGQIQFPHGPMMNPHMGLPQMGQIQTNQNIPNQMMGNRIYPNQVNPNQILPNQIPNNQIQNNLLRNNNIMNKENQNKLIPNHINQFSNNLNQNNQIINNLNQNFQNKQIQNNQMQNKQILINKIPQNTIRINQNQNNQTPLKNINPNNIDPNQLKFLQANQNNPNISPRINQALFQGQLIKKNLTQPQLINQQKPNQLNRAITQNENNNIIPMPVMNRAPSPIINPSPIKNIQAKNGQILLNRANVPNLGQNNINQQVKPIQVPLDKYSGKPLNRYPHPLETSKNGNSPKNVIHKINTAFGINRQLQKMPINNSNNFPNQGGVQRMQHVVTLTRKNSQKILNIQNNLIMNPNIRNRVSPQKIGVRPTLNFPGNNMKIPINHQ